jgi:hypothetical protein
MPGRRKKKTSIAPTYRMVGGARYKKCRCDEKGAVRMGGAWYKKVGKSAQKVGRAIQKAASAIARIGRKKKRPPPTRSTTSIPIEGDPSFYPDQIEGSGWLKKLGKKIVKGTVGLALDNTVSKIPIVGTYGRRLVKKTTGYGYNPQMTAHSMTAPSRKQVRRMGGSKVIKV